MAAAHAPCVQSRCGRACLALNRRLANGLQIPDLGVRACAQLTIPPGTGLILSDQAAKSRADLNTCGSGTLATIAEAMILPTPGMPASNWLIGLCA